MKKGTSPSTGRFFWSFNDSKLFSKTFNDSKLFFGTLNTSKLFSGTFWKCRLLKLQALDLKDKGKYARAMIELQTDVKLKHTLVVDIPKFEGDGYTMSTIRNLKMLRQAARGPPVGLEPKSNFVYRPVQPTNKPSGKKKQVGFDRQELSNSNPFDVLNMMENDDDLGVNEKNSKLAETVADAGMVSSVSLWTIN
uniref:Uncharacterized protein n=1 Tax=Tanacetum cinerariifolium TaxID=118510 RepID=A0A699IH93_TANCI|nr:hypothetical protein [Tanacetum cinerariifolium]